MPKVLSVLTFRLPPFVCSSSYDSYVYEISLNKLQVYIASNQISEGLCMGNVKRLVAAYFTAMSRIALNA
jgi:hypothetical protein